MKIISFILWIAVIILGRAIGADQADPATAYPQTSNRDLSSP